ncbi:MAG: glycosyltransferase [Hyphomonas sp.]
MPTFAISVPVGAWHPFLPHALASLKAQGPDVAVALLDASGDPRVKALGDAESDWLAYRRHGKDRGQSDAILEGWANVGGDWLGWLNADDVLMPGAIDCVRAKLATEPDLDLVYGRSTIVDETSAMTGYHFNVEPPGPRLFEGCIISQPSCFFRRTAYESVGGLNRDLHYVMDWDLWIRLYKAGARFAFLDVPMSQVLWGAETKSASLNRRRRQELRMVIGEHTPEDKQKEIFRAFAIHAIADMIWPPVLKDRVLKRLRRVGQRLCGLRADGEIADQATLLLAHYFGDAVTGVTLGLEGDVSGVSVMATVPARTVRAPDGQISLVFDVPLPAGQAVEVTVARTPGPEPLYFKRAAWVRLGP